MTAALPLTLALLAAAPPASRASALAAKKDADALLLEFRDVTRADYSDADARRVATALSRGAKASKDANAALALAGKAVQLEPNAERYAQLAELELAQDLRREARNHLEIALGLDVACLSALRLRADLAREEHDVAWFIGLPPRLLAAKVPPRKMASLMGSIGPAPTPAKPNPTATGADAPATATAP